jgi:aspartoacylase
MSKPSDVRRVAIVGATHGNEMAGGVLVDKWRRRPELATRPSFETRLFIGNPRARELVVRYVDRDLNRSFAPESLEDLDAGAYEVERARTILGEIGAAGAWPADVVFDLHTTTAAMKKTIVLVNHAPFNLELAAWAQAHDEEVRVFSWLDESLPRRSLASAFARGVTLEFGPTPQGVLRAETLAFMERTLGACLDFVEAHNRGAAPERGSGRLECFAYVRREDYPRDASGAPTAAVHPELQDRDYRALENGAPIFLGYDGEVYRLEVEPGRVLYPVFVNEAAYYEKGVAFCLTERQVLSV